ncbi:MAG TPA: molybdopterin-dependent oxidoreductase [Blastocatellia bacterium]|nr:molybdopterin-dependent oxidoreductase [Blastocatellia bacterium]
MKRRQFIILSSVGATSASLLSACGHPEEKLIPAFIADDEFVPGIDYWKASTCGMCPAGCGIIVRTREHKANKIEGNPLHPVNRGALCARGQAGLEVLYNPDRIKGPLKRVGERGEGKWEEISWDEAIKTLAGKLREIDPRSNSDKALFVTDDRKGITARVAARFMQAYGQVFITAPAQNEIESDGLRGDSLTGISRSGEEIFDIGNATYLVSFGARFLENWKSPVMYSQAYGEFRSSLGKQRGRFVHVEPRMSLTAANSDEWVAAAPGTEALLALAMVQVIVREGLNKVPLSPDSASALKQFSPENTASKTDVPAERAIRLAREFAKAERPLAIGDLHVRIAHKSLAASSVSLLNAIVGNLNRPGGVLLVEGGDESKSPLKLPDGLILPGRQGESGAPSSGSVTNENRWEIFQRGFEMMQLRYSVMMIHGFNPVFAARGWDDDLATSSFIARFASFMDETSELADLVLPEHSYLEKWDIQSSFAVDSGSVVSLTRPVLEPQCNTMQTADVLLAVARELGGQVAQALVFESAKEMVEKVAVSILAQSGSDGAWNELTERAVVSARSPVSAASQPAVHKPKEISLNTFLLSMVITDAEHREAGDYPFQLLIYEQLGLSDGSTANLPSIQELPDPLTSVMWGSWIEINPKIAAEMGITDGDFVEVSTLEGSLRAPALLYPAIRPDCIAIPVGQGHSSHGRYARGRGVNPLALCAPNESVRARLTKVGGKSQIIRFGTDLLDHMESNR